MDDGTALERAKRPRSPLVGPYGHPFHPLVVTVPIGAWISSLIFDLIAVFGNDDEAFLRGAQVLIGIGIIAAIVAAILGLVDLSGLENNTLARRTALTHMTLNLSIVVLFIVSFIIRASTGFQAVNGWALALSIVAIIALAVSGWLGGKLAYRYGVRVAGEETQKEGFR